MTREELEHAVAVIVAEPFKGHETWNAASRAAIRLVVEACCWEASTVRDDLWARGQIEAGSGAEILRATLVSTFLPPEARDGEAD